MNSSRRRYALREAYFVERAILACRNDDVDNVNEQILATFPGQEKIYYARDSVVDEGQTTEYSSMGNPCQIYTIPRSAQPPLCPLRDTNVIASSHTQLTAGSFA